MLKVGDCVRLKSGGPNMTVQRILGEINESPRIVMQDKLIMMGGYKNGDVICEWFVGTKTETKVFKVEMLEMSETK